MALEIEPTAMVVPAMLLATIFVCDFLEYHYNLQKKNKMLAEKIDDLKIELKKAKEKSRIGNYVNKLLCTNENVDNKEIADYVTRRLLHEEYDESSIYELTPLAVWASQKKLGEILTIFKTSQFLEHSDKLHSSLQLVTRKPIMKTHTTETIQCNQAANCTRILTGGYFGVLRDRRTTLVDLEDCLMEDEEGFSSTSAITDFTDTESEFDSDFSFCGPDLDFGG